MIKIVIFDDNAELLECLQLCLEHYEFKVKGTTDRKHFYWLLDNFEPDVALIDVNLSGEDGRVICRMVRDDIKYAHLPIVLFSSSSHKLKDYNVYGADGTLEKPFEVKDISASLFAAIKKRSLAFGIPITDN
jgi:DNA-binding response OmpR family regulator